MDCFVKGAFYWIEEGSLIMVNLDGESHTLVALPDELISSAMSEYEAATGCSALAGWYSRPGQSGIVPFVMGDRPFGWYWRVSFDEQNDVFYLANATAPHLILCLDRAGRPRWCRYLSCGCCGGTPYALPSGLYVASSGCCGILSWLNREGNLLQSYPHRGEGLATAYCHEVKVLPDGCCLVNGGPGIVAYSPTGERLWIFEQNYSGFHCDPARQFFVGCYSCIGEEGQTSRTVLQMVSVA